MSFDLPGTTREFVSVETDPAPRAPWLPAISAATAALIGAVACVGSLVVDGSSVIVPLAATGYLLGAVVVTALWSVQRAATTHASQHPEFRPRPVWGRLATFAMVIGFVAGAVSAFVLATEIAK